MLFDACNKFPNPARSFYANLVPQEEITTQNKHPGTPGCRKLTSVRVGGNLYYRKHFRAHRRSGYSDGIIPILFPGLHEQKVNGDT